MKDLIEEYMQDPDTYKPGLDAIVSASVSMTAIPIKVNYENSKALAIASA